MNGKRVEKQREEGKAKETLITETLTHKKRRSRHKWKPEECYPAGGYIHPSSFLLYFYLKIRVNRTGVGGGGVVKEKASETKKIEG